ncbi:MAG: hypothetical protein EZS28_056280, partial [Streblomastix strix]
MNEKANELIQSRSGVLPVSRQRPVCRSHGHDFQRRQQSLMKEKVQMKQLARLMAENQIALRPSFERVAILRLRYKYPYGFTGNFDETPFRLRDDLSTYVFFTEDAPPSPTIAPPRAKNA